MENQTFNYSLMQVLCKELKERTLSFKIIDCLPNDLRRFFLVLCQDKVQEALFFCFNPPFVRFHLVKSIPSSINSVHPLLTFLKGAVLKDICLLQKDRILQLTFLIEKKEIKLIAEFFSKHPNYYLVQADNSILFSLYPHSQKHYHLPTLHPFASSSSLWFSHHEVENGYRELEKKAQLEIEKQDLQKQLSRRIKQVIKRKHSTLENLKQCSQWQTIQHEGDLIKSSLALIKKRSDSFTVNDWITNQPYHFNLDPTKTPKEEMIFRFKQAKKLQSGQIPLTQYLEQLQKELIQLEAIQQHLHKLNALTEVLQFKNQFSLFSSPSPSPSLSPSSKKTSPSIYREYQSAAGLKIWVGKNAKSNDALTFQLANGRDWWLHTKEFPGSHVIIRLGKNQQPDPETIQDALQLALYYSQARKQEEGEICFTERKYISRLGKGKTGLVQISKHQTLWIQFDPVRLKALKERQKNLEGFLNSFT